MQGLNSVYEDIIEFIPSLLPQLIDPFPGPHSTLLPSTLKQHLPHHLIVNPIKTTDLNLNILRHEDLMNLIAVEFPIPKQL